MTTTTVYRVTQFGVTLDLDPLKYAETALGLGTTTAALVEGGSLPVDWQRTARAYVLAWTAPFFSLPTTGGASDGKSHVYLARYVAESLAVTYLGSADDNGVLLAARGGLLDDNDWTGVLDKVLLVRVEVP